MKYYLLLTWPSNKTNNRNGLMYSIYVKNKHVDNFQIVNYCSRGTPFNSIEQVKQHLEDKVLNLSSFYIKNEQGQYLYLVNNSYEPICIISNKERKLLYAGLDTDGKWKNNEVSS